MMMLASLLGGAVPAAAAEPMSYGQYKTLPQPPGPAKIAYGPAASQYVELWQPDGPGPHPVAVMLHGGCWQHEVADIGYMNAAADDLRRRGIAVWDVEYRRVDEPGGGYPGTFQDVAQALDLLKTEGPKHGLDLRRVAVIGHSAGGHLGLWAAGRANLPRSSPLWTADPLKLSGVISLGGLPDLEHAPDAIALVCGENIVGRLTGPASPAHADVYADTSPLRLLPLSAPVVMVHGVYDDIAPPWHGARFRQSAAAKGQPVPVVAIPDAGHFELVWPHSQAWPQIVELLQRAVQP